MILTKNPLKSSIFIALIFSGGLAGALDAFECVRDLMPLTEPSGFQDRRQAVEKPFMIDAKYIVFPEVVNSTLTGFYLYSSGKGWYYDAIESKVGSHHRDAIRDLAKNGSHDFYELTAQPMGLETIALRYMPGFGVDDSPQKGRGPDMLGASVLPVIGAFVPNSKEQLHVVYRDPGEVSEGNLKTWIYEHSSRKPAMVSAIEIEHKMARLVTVQTKNNDELWRPLYAELKIRRQWVQSHNLDEQAFKQLSLILKSTCRE
jgi:hypothetical protein